MLTISEFEKFIESDLVYQQNLISVIDEKGRQIFIDNFVELYKYNSCTIKLEQMEKYNKIIFNFCLALSRKYNHQGPTTCHVFRSYQNSKSFNIHTDPDDVIIYCASGKKKIFVNEIEHNLLPTDTLFIPANNPHQAINEEESLTLSFGLEKFYTEKLNHELDVLSKNDRNL
jgi:mannose-6-phosphate isomerase-like protein (cupin superfamily)